MRNGVCLNLQINAECVESTVSMLFNISRAFVGLRGEFRIGFMQINLFIDLCLLYIDPSIIWKKCKIGDRNPLPIGVNLVITFPRRLC